MKISEVRFMDRRNQGPEPLPDPLRQEVPLDAGATLEQKVIAALRTIYDPEIPVNLYDLGLIYRLHIDQRNNVEVQMTLTAPACPVAGSLPGRVEAAVRRVDGVQDAHVELVWDPPWSQERMSEQAKLVLGLF